MEYRHLGASGLQVPVLSFGTATFGGGTEFFKKWGSTDVAEARRMIDICLEAGLNLFDTADVYSKGLSEEILGEATKGLRDKILISTKSTFPMSKEPNDFGSSRQHITKSVENSLRRLQTDYIDIYHMHGFDGNTPIDETLHTLDNLIKSGKIRYIAASNFSGWHLMKSLSISERNSWAKYIGHQVYYSLINRELEWELMPLGLDQKVGTIVWSPLAGGKLGGKISRTKPAPKDTRIGQGGAMGPQIADEKFYDIVDVLETIAGETGKTVAQVALNWLLQRPTVSTLVVGARTEEQLKQNLGAVGWNLTTEQVKRLDDVSAIEPIYPYWHQRGYKQLNAALQF
jgi:aryl-alcohol dehydrogenase-like predicted oxidoreductase